MITAFLRDHDRDGRAALRLLHAGQPPAVLPQILTESAVLDQINRSGS
ncbi:MAG: hypothetical protein WDN49_05975 [Acetobacteraceae bacterium]